MVGALYVLSTILAILVCVFILECIDFRLNPLVVVLFALIVLMLLSTSLIALTVLTLASPLSMMTTSTHFRHYHGTSFMLVDSCVIAPTMTTLTMDISSMGTLTTGTSTSRLYISTLAQKITVYNELPVSFLSQLTI